MPDRLGCLVDGRNDRGVESALDDPAGILLSGQAKSTNKGRAIGKPIHLACVKCGSTLRIAMDWLWPEDGETPRCHQAQAASPVF